jgi:aspartate/methionine/tyrosine aminotransferase
MFSKRTEWKLQPNRYTEACERFRAQERVAVDLTASNPTNVGLDYDSESILKSFATPESLRYRPESKGLLSARKAVAEYYHSLKADISPERIVLTTSTSEAYAFIFRLLCDPGDEILVPAPSYPLFQFLADLQVVTLVPYPLLYDHGWQIDMRDLESKLTERSRAVIVVHPNNPTGSFVKPKEMRALCWLCSHRQMALVADEVFLDFVFDGPAQHTSAENSGALTFTVSGLSKIAGLPQMKASWVVTSGPEALANEAMARLDVIADTFLSMSTPVQLALPTLIEQRHAFHHQLQVRLRANLKELDRQLAKQSLIRRLDVEGGWYVVLRVPATRSDEDLAIELLEKQSVLVHPGHFFDFPEDGYLVLSLLPSREDFRKGIEQVLHYFQDSQNSQGQS